MKVLVCGGRKYNDYEKVDSILNQLNHETPISYIIQGGAPGADRLAQAWALTIGVQTVTFDANWTYHHNSAGLIRNRNMVSYLKPDLVVAFPGGTGTEDMISVAKQNNIPVKIVT